MGGVHDGTLDQAELLVTVAATGFYDDPVMTWVFPDDTTRLAGLRMMFDGLVRDFLPGRGTVHVVDDACATFWRRPDFDYESGGGEGEQGESPWDAEVLERFAILDRGMKAVHPHERHWYLNVISTLPDHQGRGLGTRALLPVLTTCDADGVPAYLESSNPRNMTLYGRHGFDQTGEIPLPDGPSLYPMWRPPR